jgi:hypothetical protein
MNDASTAHGRLMMQLNKTLGPKPPNNAKQELKKAYSEKVSRVVAMAVAAELRKRGLEGARPTEAGLDEKSGAERRMAGGIGAKKVDITWSKEESGLLIAFSIKSINFKDAKTKNYQKKLTNRRRDLLFESITLHRRFPFSVLVGLFFFDEEAKRDHTATRRSTFENAHERLELFTGRVDPTGRDEQYEHLYVGLLGICVNDTTKSFCEFYRVGNLKDVLSLDDVLSESLRTLLVRNADLYEIEDGKVQRTQGPRRKGKSKKADYDDIDDGDE